MSARVAVALGASVALHLVGFAVLLAVRASTVAPVRPPSPPVAEWVSVDLAPRSRVQAAPADRSAAPRVAAPKRAAKTVVEAAAEEVEPEWVDVGLSASSPGVSGTGLESVAAVGAVGSPGGAGSGNAAAGDAHGAEGAGSADLSALHARLSAAAAQCYPASARRFRMRGRTLVSFCTREGGEVSRIEQKQSSGSPILDRAALECVLPRAAPLPGPAGCFTAPIVFDDAP